MDSSPRRNSGKKGSLRKSGSGTGSRKNSSSNISRQGSQKSINKVSPQTPSSSSISEDNDNNNSTSPQQADEMVISSNESTPTTNKQSDISLNENHTAVPTTPTTSAKVSKAQQQQERNRFATAPVKQSPKHGNSSTNVDELSKRTSQQLQSKDPISMSSVHASPRHRRSVSPGRIQVDDVKHSKEESTKKSSSNSNMPEFRVTYGLESIRGHRPTQEDSHIARQPTNQTKPEDFKTAEDERKEREHRAEKEKEAENRNERHSPTPNVNSLDDKLKSHARTNLTPKARDAIEETFSFFGVFDGHGGDEAAHFTSARLYSALIENFKKTPDDVTKVLKESFAITEAEFMKKAQETMLAAGTTAAVALLKEPHLYVANVGDSEVVLSRSGKAQLMSECHNPKKNPAEAERVTAAGGVIWQYRLGHPIFNPAFLSLAVSRAIGDIMFKQSQDTTQGRPSGLTAEPHIKDQLLTKDDEFLIVACDGVWDVYEYQEAVDFVGAVLKSHEWNAQKAAEELAKSAFEKGSRDNITTLIIVFFTPEKK